MTTQNNVASEANNLPKDFVPLMLENFFGPYIGQTKVIKRLNKILSQEKAGVLRPLYALDMEGLPGLGKTKIAEMIGEARAFIHGLNVDKAFIVIPPSIAPTKLFKILMEEVNGKTVTIFIDEYHAMSDKVANILKPILETNGKIKEVRLNETDTFISNPFEQLWLFASNESSKDHAIKGARTETLSFVAYSKSEKIALIEQAMALESITIDEDAIEYLSERIWPNARAIFRSLCPKIACDARFNAGHIDLAFAREFAKEEGLFPKGLDRKAFKTLKFLGRADDGLGRMVSEIASHCGETDNADASYRLAWLSSFGFVATGGAQSRKLLTKEGAAYLREVADMQKAAKEAAKASVATIEEKPIPDAPKAIETPIETPIETAIEPPKPLAPKAKAKVVVRGKSKGK